MTSPLDDLQTLLAPPPPPDVLEHLPPHLRRMEEARARVRERALGDPERRAKLAALGLLEG